MISWAIVILLGITITGFIVMFHALHNAVDGYEDGDGFHQGAHPWTHVPLAVVVSTENARENVLDDRAHEQRVVQPSCHGPGEPLGVC